MTITITVEDEYKGKRFIADRQITDLEIDYANFDLLGTIVNDLRAEVKAQRNAELPDV